MLQKRNPAIGFAERFLDTAQYIQEHGWCQGRMHEGEKVCISAAFYESGLCVYNEYPPIEEAKAFADMFYHLVGATVSRWNDVKGRTKEEVIAKLEEIAAKLKEPLR